MVLSVVFSTIPFQSSGYTLRSQAILKNTSHEVRTFGKIGYPWAAGLLKGTKTEHNVDVDGVIYRHRRGRIDSQNHTFNNIGLAKRELERVIYLENPDVVHAASNFVNALPALLAAREFGLPFVYEMRGFWELTAGVGVHGWTESERYLLERRLERTVAIASDVVIALSEVQKEELIAWGVERDRIRVVFNCHDGGAEAVEAHLSPSEKLTGLRTAVSGRNVLGYIGSLVRYEGLQDLLAVMAEPASGLQDWILLIAGDGPYASELRALAEHLQLGEKVIFAGRVQKHEVDEVYRLIDVCVLPRLPEPVCQLITPLKPIECLAQGRVLLVSDVDAMVEQVRKFGYGETFEAGSRADLARRLREILIDLDLYKARYASAAASIRDRFSWSAGVAAWDDAVSLAAGGAALAPDAGVTTVDLFNTSLEIQRERLRQFRRVSRITVTPAANTRLLLRWRELEPEDVRVLSLSATGVVASAVALSRPSDLGGKDLIELGLTNEGEQTLFVYVDRARFKGRAGHDLALMTYQPDVLGPEARALQPLKAEVRDIIAVELVHHPERPAKIEIENGYGGGGAVRRLGTAP